MTDEGYVGLDVHRAARIAAAGHGGPGAPVAGDAGPRRRRGGTRSRRAPAQGSLGAGAPLPAGRRRLPAPEDAVSDESPRPGDAVSRPRARARRGRRSLAARRTSGCLRSPAPAGRERRGWRCRRRPRSPRTSRTACGGSRSRALRDPALALDAVAKTLDVRERPGFTLEETLVDTLAAKRALLLIDNAEHLLPAGRDATSRAFGESGGPKLLVTSRERLQLAGRARVGGAVARRPRRRGPVHGAGARAATGVHGDARDRRALRAPRQPPARTRARGRARPDLLARNSCSNGWGTARATGGRDADPRQQTLDATIRWSYDLLAPEEQRLFARLAVFAGGCTYEAAEAVCAADVDTLQSLIDKSLVRSREAAGGDRYWMLETIREFAAAELEGVRRGRRPEAPSRGVLHGPRGARRSPPAARPRPAAVGRARGGGLRQRPRRHELRARARSHARATLGGTDFRSSCGSAAASPR